MTRIRSICVVVAAVLTGLALPADAGPGGEPAPAVRANNLDSAHGTRDFCQEYALRAFQTTTDHVQQSAGFEAGLAVDPSDPGGGRSVLNAHVFTATDHVLYNIRQKYIYSGNSAAAPFRPNEVRAIMQMRLEFPSGVTQTGGSTRATYFRFLNSGSNRFADGTMQYELLLSEPGVAQSFCTFETAIGAATSDAGPDMSSLLGQWVTAYVRYKSAFQGVGTGVGEVHWAPGHHYSQESVTSDPGVISHVFSHDSFERFAASQITVETVNSSDDYRASFRMIGFAIDGREPELIEQMRAGRMLDVDTAKGAINIQSMAPPGMFRDAWRQLGGLRTSVLYWETALGEGSAQETPKETANASEFWITNHRITGLTLSRKEYSFRIRYYHPTNDSDFADAGLNTPHPSQDFVLHYRPPIGDFKVMVSTCSQSTGGAHPWWAYEHALDAGCIAGFMVDDPWYADGKDSFAAELDGTEDAYWAHMWEGTEDRYQWAFARTAPLFVTHGDHQVRNEWSWQQRGSDAALANAFAWGMKVWNKVHADAAEGNLDPDYGTIDSRTHWSRAFRYGPLYVVAIDDTWRDIGNTSLIGTNLFPPTTVNADLKASWDADDVGDASLVVWLTSHVTGPDAFAGFADLTINNTMWNFTPFFMNELEELMNDFSAKNPEKKGCFWVGDLHIAKHDTITSRDDFLFSFAGGPMASPRFNGAIPNDWSSISDASVHVGDVMQGNIDFAISEGSTSEHFARFWGLAEVSGCDNTVQMSILKADPDDTSLLFTSAAYDMSPIPCEFNGAPGVTAEDLLSYLFFWFEEAFEADFDGSGLVEVSDLLAYLSCWFQATDASICP